ncbi:MAG: hypothetical protein AAF596_00410, partial [Planctomycetota bacterium]
MTLTTGNADTLRVELQQQDGALQSFELPLDQLRVSSYTTRLQGSAGSLYVHRLPEDQIRVETDRASLVFDPGERFEFSVEAPLVGVEPLSPVDFRVQVLRGRDGPTISDETTRIDFPVTGSAELPFAVALPTEEGAYTVKIDAVRPPGLTARFLPRSNGKEIAERSVQVVVWDSDTRQRLEDAGTLLAEIDPTAPRWWERVPRWVWPRRLARPEEHLGSLEPTVVGAGAVSFIELPAPADQAAGTPGPWHAYPLPVAGPNVPHVVEIDYPIDQAQTLTISLLDKNAIGEDQPLGGADEVFVGDWPLSDPASDARDGVQVRTARRLFWPTTDAPLLVVSNHGERPARFGRVRVYRLNEMVEPASRSADQDEQRLVALAVASARAPDAANATFAAAPDGSFVFEDWQTWFETAKRLADLVELQGCNAAAITVASSSGPIYPSEVFAATPGTDRSPLAHGVVDLPWRDPLALIFREFDRRGLSLIPTIVFDAAVPSVAPAVASSRSVTSELSTPRAVYAAASPSTARIMRRAVVEIVDRYAQHSSFAALAIDLGGGGAWDYSLLQPATDAPIDSQLDDFLASSGVAWPTGVPRSPETIRVALGGPWRAAWSGWRREQLTDMYRSLA